MGTEVDRFIKLTINKEYMKTVLFYKPIKMCFKKGNKKRVTLCGWIMLFLKEKVSC